MATIAATTRRRPTHGTPRSVSRRLGRGGRATYIGLMVVALASAFPIYWSLVVASHDNSAIGAWPPILVPGGQLWHNLARLFTANVVNVDFWLALANSFIVAATVAAGVGLFSALAGVALPHP